MDNSNASINVHNKLKKQISRSLYFTLFLYTIIGLSTIMIINTVTLGDNSFLASLRHWLNLRLDIILVLYIIIGYCFIFKYYFNKPWKYFNEVLGAAEKLCEKNDSIIRLSDPLRELEAKFNQITMTMMFNQQAATKLQYKKDELIMYLAHDIRTPLTSIIGYLSLIDELPEMETKKKIKYIKLTLDKSYRLEKLINEFFEFTRYNSHQIKLNIETVDLYYLLFQMIDEFYPILHSNGNIAKLDADENITILGDPIKLVRAFGNILKNATAYSFANTEITISAKVVNNMVQVNFKNMGNTIQDEKLSHIFDKFYRGDDARNSNTGGAGLGLAIAKEIILLHNGQICAHSKNNIIDITVMIPINISKL